MNSSEADRQIEQMIAFIAQEAKEKAEEISVKTEKEFMAEKLSLETNLSIQIRADHEKAKKDYYIQKRIEKSKLLSESRFATMRKRDDKMNELKKTVLEQLNGVSKDKKYSQLIRFLIAQGLQTILEHTVVIQCRKEDLKVVEGELAAAVKMFQDNMSKACGGVVPTAEVSIDSTNFLLSGSCAGGVVLSARNGQILCRNTLDHRLDIAFESLKPTLRGAIFGVRPKAGVSAPKKK